MIYFSLIFPPVKKTKANWKQFSSPGNEKDSELVNTVRGTDHWSSAQAHQRRSVTLSPPAKPRSALTGIRGQEGAGLWTHRMSQSVPRQSVGSQDACLPAWGYNTAASWVLPSYSWKEARIGLPILSGVKSLLSFIEIALRQTELGSGFWFRW